MTTRPLTARERAILTRLLSVPMAGAEQLRQQAAEASTQVSTEVGLILSVPASAPPALRPDGPLPLTAEVFDPAGRYLGELLLWVRSGQLARLEYAWVSDDPPSALPAPETIRVAAT